MAGKKCDCRKNHDIPSHHARNVSQHPVHGGPECAHNLDAMAKSLILLIWLMGAPFHDLWAQSIEGMRVCNAGALEKLNLHGNACQSHNPHESQSCLADAYRVYVDGVCSPYEKSYGLIMNFLNRQVARVRDDIDAKRVATERAKTQIDILFELMRQEGEAWVKRGRNGTSEMQSPLMVRRADRSITSAIRLIGGSLNEVPNPDLVISFILNGRITICNRTTTEFACQ